MQNENKKLKQLGKEKKTNLNEVKQQHSSSSSPDNSPEHSQEEKGLEGYSPTFSLFNSQTPKEDEPATEDEQTEELERSPSPLRR